MTKDEGQMTKEIRNPKPEESARLTPGSDFVLRHSFELRHSEFVIWQGWQRDGHLSTPARYPSASPNRAHGSQGPALRLLPGLTGRASRQGFAPRRDRARRLVRPPATAWAG